MSRVRRNLCKEDIKAMVWRRGTTLRQISLQAGLNIHAASEALRKPFPAANTAIADFLGKSLNDLWPCWYDQHGNRITVSEHRRNLTQLTPPVSVNSSQTI